MLDEYTAWFQEQKPSLKKHSRFFFRGLMSFEGIKHYMFFRAGRNTYWWVREDDKIRLEFLRYLFIKVSNGEQN